jgi:glyoxylase-like metal-dependent hydrolase (beta-lactamase superfamily II)
VFDLLRGRCVQGRTIMTRTLVALIALAGMTASTAAAQDAKTAVSAASKAMGVENLSSVYFYGTAANGNLGQNNNANQPWPLTPLNDYRRAIDFSQPASRATALTMAVSVVTSQLEPGVFNQNITPANMAWAQQLEIWITPWGFLKGAAANNATAKAQTVGGKRYTVVTWLSPIKSPSGASYRLVGYIDANNLVDRVQTWLENPIFGDMLVEAEYTNYRDNNGLKYPATIVQKRGGWPTFQAQILAANANPSNIQQLLTAAAPAAPVLAGQAGRAAGPPPAPPAGGRGGAAPPPPMPASEKLAEGVYRITQVPGQGAYNALAVEFSDHVLLFEPGPQNEARAQAIIGETKKVIPNKPIRYGVLSHHHFDHTSGLPAVVAEGITIVTHETNRAFLMNALSAPRTLAPDSMSKSGKKPKIEGIVGDKRVFQDATRTVEVHLIKGLPHADGLLVAYLPKEKILAYADMFNLPAADNPVPNPPVVGTMVFLDNIDRLKLEPERILSVHSLNPDRLATRADIVSSLGRK